MNFKIWNIRLTCYWESEGYRYHNDLPRLLIGIYYGTVSRGLIWGKQFTFLGLKNEN